MRSTKSTSSQLGYHRDRNWIPCCWMSLPLCSGHQSSQVVNRVFAGADFNGLEGIPDDNFVDLWATWQLYGLSESNRNCGYPERGTEWINKLWINRASGTRSNEASVAKILKANAKRPPYSGGQGRSYDKSMNLKRWSCWKWWVFFQQQYLLWLHPTRAKTT